jgi:hypothetical protein
MKKILILLLGVSLFLVASDKNSSESAKKARLEDQIKKEMQKEKKYAKEQVFYKMENYDFKGSEVNPATVDATPEIEEDDFDMDSVYD